MSTDLSNSDIRAKLEVATNKEITFDGTDDFITNYSSIEFNFSELMRTFSQYCKDFCDNLSSNKTSYALEFSTKMIFEHGTYFCNEKKSKSCKAIRFRFPYKTENGTLNIKSVIVTTIKEMSNKIMFNEGEIIMTFGQARLLAMVTFSKAITYAYSVDRSYIPMTPLCRAVFSKASIRYMATELNLEVVEVIKMINESICSGGQYLPNSDLSCALVGIINGTKRNTNPNVRNHMISNLIKEYSVKHKEYIPERFTIFAKYALGGVPPGLDAKTLIHNYNNIQTSEINLRAQVLATKQSEMTATLPDGRRTTQSTSRQFTGVLKPTTRSQKK